MFHQTSYNFFQLDKHTPPLHYTTSAAMLIKETCKHVNSHCEPLYFFGLKKTQPMIQAKVTLLEIPGHKFSDINAPDITKTWPTVCRLSFASFSTRENLHDTIWRCGKRLKKLYDNCFLM